MDDDAKAKADERLQEALEESGIRDPRDGYRSRLRELKASDSAAYEEGVRHFEEELVPAVASGERDPLEAWQRYGMRLAELAAPGRTVEIDATGRSHAFDPPAVPDRMVLHLPDDRRTGAMPISLPSEPSSAQRAAYDVLVRGKRSAG